MSKVAFCFPGQGSLEVGMGREIAEAYPKAMDVYRTGSEVTGMDLAHLCFEAPLEELVETEVQQPTLVATSLAILAAVREEGIEPDIVVLGKGLGNGVPVAVASGRADLFGSLGFGEGSDTWSANPLMPGMSRMYVFQYVPTVAASLRFAISVCAAAGTDEADGDAAGVTLPFSTTSGIVLLVPSDDVTVKVR